MKKTVKTTRWNAELDTDVCDRYNNANLTLTRNLGFRQINPPAGATQMEEGHTSAPAPVLYSPLSNLSDFGLEVQSLDAESAVICGEGENALQSPMEDVRYNTQSFADRALPSDSVNP